MPKVSTSFGSWWARWTATEGVLVTESTLRSQQDAIFVDYAGDRGKGGES